MHIDTDFASLLSGRVFGVGDIQSLEEVGLELKDDGTLSLDKDKLRARQTESPEGVQAFFQTKDLGLAAKIDKLIEGLAGEDDSILVNRAAALERKIQVNDQRVKFFNEFLTRKRDVLLNQFYTLESTIAKIQANTNALGALNALANPTA